VREGDLWPRLRRIRKIIFDKTGTLTLETPRLLNPAALVGLAPHSRRALLALVEDNPHPVSQSLYEALLGDGLVAGLAPIIGEVGEVIGEGVSLQTRDGRWSLGRSTAAGHDTEFACDGVVLARFRFEDAVRADARDEITGLQAAGFRTFILSGDRHEKVASMAAALGIPAAQALAGVGPQQKAAWVRQLDRRDTLMLGDGANDSLAFDAAFVRGTPVVHRGVLEGKADFYYLGRGLDGLRRLFEVNEARRRTQAWLLVFSVAYNVVAVGLAVAGRMSPLGAAILMPVSSLLSLAIVGAGLRRITRRRAGALPR
jgi:Cu2+-exporting ATPase